LFKIRGARLLWGLALLMVVALLALAAACGGDDDGDDGETPEAGETVEADAGDDGDGDGDGDGGDADGDAGALSASLEGVGFQNLKATYTVDFPGAGGVFNAPGIPAVANQAISGTMVIAERPPSDMRFELRTTTDGVESTVIVITVPDEGVALPLAFFGAVINYVCSESGGTGTCFVAETDEVSQQTSLLTTLSESPAQLAASASEFVEEVSDETIGGVDSTCYTVNTPSTAKFSPGDPLSAIAALGGDQAQVCVGHDPALLTRLVTVAGSFELTEVGTPTDADFEPPYEVIDFGDILPEGIPTQ